VARRKWELDLTVGVGSVRQAPGSEQQIRAFPPGGCRTDRARCRRIAQEGSCALRSADDHTVSIAQLWLGETGMSAAASKPNRNPAPCQDEVRAVLCRCSLVGRIQWEYFGYEVDDLRNSL
jgi:hypothetical protein